MAKRCFVEFERRRIACEDCEALSIGDVDLLSWDSRTKTATSLLWFRILPDLMRRWQESAWFRSGYYILEGKHVFFCSQGRAGEAGVGGADLFSLYFIAWHVSHH